MINGSTFHQVLESSNSKLSAVLARPQWWRLTNPPAVATGCGVFPTELVARIVPHLGYSRRQAHELRLLRRPGG